MSRRVRVRAAALWVRAQAAAIAVSIFKQSRLVLAFGSAALYRLRWGRWWGRERILRRHEALQRRHSGARCRAKAIRCLCGLCSQGSK